MIKRKKRSLNHFLYSSYYFQKQIQHVELYRTFFFLDLKRQGINSNINWCCAIYHMVDPLKSAKQCKWSKCLDLWAVARCEIKPKCDICLLLTSLTCLNICITKDEWQWWSERRRCVHVILLFLPFFFFCCCGGGGICLREIFSISIWYLIN